MKRILSCSLLLASAIAAFACSKSASDAADPGPGNVDPDPSQEDGAAPPVEDDAGTGSDADAAPVQGTVDPSGSPILLGTPRTVRTFTPPGGTPLFVDGTQWIASKSALFVALPFATNLNGGKGILTTFKSDGTNYTELRFGDKITTGVVGNSIDMDGNLISAELKSITRTNAATGAMTVIATGYDATGADAGNTAFDGPNDLIGLKDGSIFFTDPGYNVTPRPLVGHLFRIALDGTVTVAATYDFNPSPNGIALSKDEKTLFVGFTSPGANTNPFIRKYTVAVDGTLADMGKYIELPMGSDPDGLAVDDSDNLFVGLSTGIAVFKSTGLPYGTKVPQTLIAGGAVSLSYGGTDRQSLFVTTMGKVLEFKTIVPGLLQ